MNLRKLHAALTLSVVVILVGCASPANREAMTVANFSVVKKLEKSISVKTSGGTETGLAGSTNISDEDLKAAIEDSLQQAKIFQSVVQGNNGDYDLQVIIFSLEKPAIGFSMTVNMEAVWTLTRKTDGYILMKKSIRSTHTTGAFEAFGGVTRVRMAVEGAAKKNIEAGLREIASLTL